MPLAPRVSIALCTWNGARFLLQQLKSLAAQTMLPAELVICDDGSTDDTLLIASRFADTAPFPVRVVSNERRLGYRANFMKAARLCSADLVAFCDQDDIWLPAKLERCALPFEDPAVMLVIHEADVCDANGNPSGRSLYQGLGVSLGSALPDPWIHALGFTEVFRRDVLGLPDIDQVRDHLSGELLAHDQIVLFAALILGRIHFIAEPLAAYRQHGDNACGTEEVTLAIKLRFLFADRSQAFAEIAGAAASRSAFLRTANSDWRWNGVALRPSLPDRYERIHEIFDLRTRLYRETRIRRRLQLFLQLVSMRAYRNVDGWQLSSRHWVRDMFFGVVMRRMLRRSAGQ